MEKPKIKYPCTWSYRIIGQDEQMLRKAAVSVAGGKKYTLSASNRSSGGKYYSFNFEIDVKDNSERLSIYDCLGKDPAIKMVL